MDIINLKPQRVWKHFYSLTQIPRPSKKEEKVRAFLAEFGRNLGLETVVDPTGNVIIRKPATPGMENRKGDHSAGTYGYGSPEKQRDRTRL